MRIAICSSIILDLSCSQIAGDRMRELQKRDRMRELQKRADVMRHAGVRFTALSDQASDAGIAYEKATTSFIDYKNDLIGDLFNGCFGQEWLLHGED